MVHTDNKNSRSYNYQTQTIKLDHTTEVNTASQLLPKQRGITPYVQIYTRASSHSWVGLGTLPWLYLLLLPLLLPLVGMPPGALRMLLRCAATASCSLNC